MGGMGATAGGTTGAGAAHTPGGMGATAGGTTGAGAALTPGGGVAARLCRPSNISNT